MEAKTSVQDANKTAPSQSGKKKRLRTIMFVVLALLLVGGALYGMYAWQHQKAAESSKLAADRGDEISVLNNKVSSLESQLAAAGSNQPVNAEAQTYTFAFNDLKKALPSDCSLTATSASDLKTVAANGAAGGELGANDKGRINEDKSWAFVAGGCGSQGMSFVLARLSANTWTMVDQSWSNLPTCSGVDYRGVPAAVAGTCIDDTNGDVERTIK